MPPDMPNTNIVITILIIAYNNDIEPTVSTGKICAIKK